MLCQESETFVLADSVNVDDIRLHYQQSILSRPAFNENPEWSSKGH
jgi:hypothetical protein